jgi:hypothetical protein
VNFNPMDLMKCPVRPVDNVENEKHEWEKIEKE